MSRDKYNKIVDKVLGKSWLTAYMECNDIATYQKCEVSCYRSGSMLVYHCKTCSKQDDCYICSDCFVPEKHKGHDYVIVEKKHFYCSCGSADKMNSKGFCNKHGYKNNDNVFKLVPKGYNGLAERMEKLIQMCIIAHNVDNTDLFQETVAAILDLTQMPLHFLMLARILSKPLQKQQNSKLVEKCGYTKVSYFERLYEIYFLQYHNNNLNFLLSTFTTNMDLITFPHSSIFDLCILSLTSNIPNTISIQSTSKFHYYSDTIPCKVVCLFVKVHVYL